MVQVLEAVCYVQAREGQIVGTEQRSTRDRRERREEKKRQKKRNKRQTVQSKKRGKNDSISRPLSGWVKIVQTVPPKIKNFNNKNKNKNWQHWDWENQTPTLQNSTVKPFVVRIEYLLHDHGVNCFLLFFLLSTS